MATRKAGYKKVERNHKMLLMAGMPYEFAANVATRLDADMNAYANIKHGTPFAFVVSMNSNRKGWDLAVESTIPLAAMTEGRCWGDFIKGYTLCLIDVYKPIFRS